jgi:hypothetical protein
MRHYMYFNIIQQREYYVYFISGSNTDGTCVLDEGYITYYTYTCNNTTNTYTLTIPRSYLTESLHGTT